MVSVQEIISDPDLAQSYSVTRSAGGQFGAGGWQEGTPQSLQLIGTILPATQEDLQQVPEGDRVTGAMTFYSTQRIYRTHTDGSPGTSDILIWNGDQYRVSWVKNYSDYGYWKAVAVLMEGS